jgi:hypothetical protein
VQVARLVVLAWALAAGPASADPATEIYAPAQLSVAQRELDRAIQHMLQGETEAARRFASQAALDARLTWGMTDDDYLRRQAERIYFTASSLKEENP